MRCGSDLRSKSIGDGHYKSNGVYLRNLWLVEYFPKQLHTYGAYLVRCYAFGVNAGLLGCSYA